jgi:hypothetical protein
VTLLETQLTSRLVRYIRGRRRMLDWCFDTMKDREMKEREIKV